MNRICELAERVGLVSPEKIELFVHGAPLDIFCKLVESTTLAVLADELATDKAAGTAVLASSSMRTDSGCREWECRKPKLEALARYACLYADRLVVPIPLSHLHASEQRARYALGDLFYKLSILRPLFDAGIAVFAPDVPCICTKCVSNFEALWHQHDSASFEVYLERLGQDINVIYRPPTSRKSWSIELFGPTDYVPHGQLKLQFLDSRTPSWAPRKLGKIAGRLGAELDAKKVRKHRIGGTHFAELARDAVIQQYIGIPYNAPYVTDSIVEAQFLERVYPRNDLTLGVKTLLDQMTHDIPLLGELPMRRILRIRQSDREYFVSYRNALQQVIRQHLRSDRQLTPEAAREICADVIRPQVEKLGIDAREKRRSAVRKAAAGTVAVSAAVGLGLISGMIPPELQRVFQLGAVALAGKLGDILGAIERYPAEVRSHNMFFLLKLNNAG